MAKRRSRVRPLIDNLENVRNVQHQGPLLIEEEPVPALVLGAVNGLEAVAVGALQVTKGLLTGVVGGVVDLGTVALTVAFTGARGVVAVASRTASNIATTTKETVEETASSIRRAG